MSRPNRVTSPLSSIRYVLQTRVVGEPVPYLTLTESSSINTINDPSSDLDNESIIVGQLSSSIQRKLPGTKPKPHQLGLHNVILAQRKHSYDENSSLLGSNGNGSSNFFESTNMTLGGGGEFGSLLATTSREYRPPTPSMPKFGDTLPYYLPCFLWIPHYCWDYFWGDLIGGLSLVFFQLPLSLSYALLLAKVPILCGMYSLAISPLIYMIFGSVPQMIVGPEAAISLIVGQAVEPIMHHSKKHPIDATELVVAITFVSGTTLLGFGIGRFGFLDNVLLALLLKGFISGVGIVMVVSSLIVMLGLLKLLEEISNDPSLPDIHSPFDKFMFLVRNVQHANPLTLKFLLLGFVGVSAIRIFKKWHAKKQLLAKQTGNKEFNENSFSMDETSSNLPQDFLQDSSIEPLTRGKSRGSRYFGIKSKLSKCVVYIPEILLLVIISTCILKYYRFDEKGLEIIGLVGKEPDQRLIFNPLSVKSLKLSKKLATGGFLCAMLGFFESTTALKLLGLRYDLPISLNRELVALGFINIACAAFGALPAFGGYGRSKINAILAKTCMLGGIMGICTIITIVFLMDALQFIPKCTLNVVTCVIGILLIEEAPHELWFHWRSRGYDELITFFITVITTLFFSMEAGIAVGLVYLLIRVIRHLASLRIQILGRVPNTNTFLNADLTPKEQVEAYYQTPGGFGADRGQMSLFTENVTQLNYQALEEIEGCLIVKIPEPLTFTNASDLKSRLRRVEMYGLTKAHPALKRTRDSTMTKYIIFDLLGMTQVDSSAAQVLEEILTNYEDRRIFCFFVRVSLDSEIRERLQKTGILDLLMRDLRDLRYFETANLAKLSGDSKITNLTESSSLPYFGHIRDALKVIDNYENNR